MPNIKRYKAKRDLKLDCGHSVKTGEEFVVSKFFTCEKDAPQLKSDQKPTEPKAPESK